MALSQTIKDLVARSAQTSTIDEAALDELCRRVLEALIRDPDTPQHLRDALARRLSPGTEEPSSPPSGTPDETAG